MGLRQDIRETLSAWKAHVGKAAVILISCPRTMTKDLFNGNEEFLKKNDPRLRRLPLDVGRPTFESVCIAHEVLMTVSIRERATVNLIDNKEKEEKVEKGGVDRNSVEESAETKNCTE